MKEEYLQYLFRMKLLGNSFQTIDGTNLEIVSFGKYNLNSGPDFLDCKIKFDKKLWYGPIEFHVKASDWYVHKHENDKAYNNVIAHFVYEADKDIYLNKFKIPTVELKSLINEKHYRAYRKLTGSKQAIPCQSSIVEVDEFFIEQQKERAIIQRLQKKSNQILSELARQKGDLEKTFYTFLAIIFGGKVNQLPFENLAQRISLVDLKKVRTNPILIEAMLLGISGLLPKKSDDKYVQKLIQEYDFQKSKNNLIQMESLEWRYSKMRPHGFPPIRIAQFANLLSKNLNISQLLLHDNSLNEVRRLFKLNLCEYWETHYRFENETKRKSTNLSNDFIDLICMNSIVPFKFALGVLNDDEKIKKSALNMLLELKPEKNSIIDSWKKLGLNCKTAFDSQALIEQKNHFCLEKKCLFCTVGTKLLQS